MFLFKLKYLFGFVSWAGASRLVLQENVSQENVSQEYVLQEMFVNFPLILWIDPGCPRESVGFGIFAFPIGGRYLYDSFSTL